MCIANSLYSSDDVASQRSAPAQDMSDDGAFGEDGMDDAEGPVIVDLTSTEGHTPQVGLIPLWSHSMAPPLCNQCTGK